MSKNLQQIHRDVWKSLQEALGDRAQDLFDAGRQERHDVLQSALYARYPMLGLSLPDATPAD